MEQPTEEIFRVRIVVTEKSGSESYRNISACHLGDQRLQRTGVNRRLKRTHIKGIRRPVPNEHSQLFISLLDSGRPSPF